MGEQVLITGTSIPLELFQPLVEAGYSVSNPTHLLSSQELKERLAETSAYLLGGDEFADKNALSSARKLKVISFLGVGYQRFIDVAAANKLGIKITNTPGAMSNSVAEFTIGLILAATRKLYHYANNLALGIEGVERKTHELSGLHCGIIGLGASGTRIAEILRNGFNCSVSYYSRTRKEELELSLGLSFMDLESLVLNVDVLILMLPKTELTVGLINDKVIERRNKGLVLINAANPEIVSPTALLAGFKNGKIEYAAYDPFYPPSDDSIHELRKFIPDRLIITGHIAALTYEAREKMAKMSVQSMLNVLQSGNDNYIVNGVPSNGK